MQNNIIIERRAVEPFLKNGYILACGETKQGIYIDPGDEAPQLLQWLAGASIQLTAIVNTHAHMDHICGIGRVKQAWDVPIYLHRDDQFLYERLQEQAQWFGLTYSPAPALNDYLEEGESLSVGRLHLRVHHTPGHSPGGVCLEVGEHIFCGDLIFAGSIGRTDLPGGDYETLIRSIKEKVFPLGDEKILHPGHGPDTTIGRERATNPFLAED